jgi:hypothetical protein
MARHYPIPVGANGGIRDPISHMLQSRPGLANAHSGTLTQKKFEQRY